MLVHLRTNKIYTLNETGSRLWELVLEGRDSASIKQELQKEYDAEPVEIEQEVDRLLTSLAAEELVSSEEPG